MSAREMLQTGVRATLAEALDGVAVFDAPPVRMAAPYAVVEEPLLADWSTKDMTGREGRIAVQLHDTGERPARLRALIGRAEDAVEGTDPALGEGWRIVTLGLVRSRIVRAPECGGRLDGGERISGADVAGKLRRISKWQRKREARFC